jgi:hypothetical protein
VQGRRSRGGKCQRAWGEDGRCQCMGARPGKGGGSAGNFLSDKTIRERT